MRLNPMIAFCLCLLPAMSACSQVQTRSISGEVRPVRSASGKTLHQAMGSGLMGSAFEAMSQADRTQALQAEYRALEYGHVGQIVSWQAVKRPHSGEVTAGRFYKVGSQNCRQYSHNFYIAGLGQNVSASACRNEDGSWSPLL